jgi:hypothetical protein
MISVQCCDKLFELAAPELGECGIQILKLACKTMVLIAKYITDDVHKLVRNGHWARSAGSLSALPRGRACQQQPNMTASAYTCPRCAGARRGYHSTVSVVAAAVPLTWRA